LFLGVAIAVARSGFLTLAELFEKIISRKEGYLKRCIFGRSVGIMFFLQAILNAQNKIL